jgi:hypothetical protein
LNIIYEFIHVGYQTIFDDSSIKIFRLINDTPKNISIFNFATCIFILNKSDIYGNNDIKNEDNKYQIKNTFDGLFTHMFYTYIHEHNNIIKIVDS